MQSSASRLRTQATSPAFGASLAMLVLLGLAPAGFAQRGADGPRVARLASPQTNLPALGPTTLVPRKQQIAHGLRPTIVVTG